MADLPKLSKEALREVASQVIWSYWPYWGAPLVSAVLAYAKGYNLVDIWLIALFSFAMIAFALNNLSQWMGNQTPAGKVDFLIPVVGVKNATTKNPPELHGLKLGALLGSKATFPLEIRMDDLEAQIGDRVPCDIFPSTAVQVGQGGVGQFTSSLIDLSDLDRANKVLYGRLKAVVSYGRPGKLKHNKQQQWYLALKFDKDGNFEAMEQSVTEFTRDRPTH